MIGISLINTVKRLKFPARAKNQQDRVFDGIHGKREGEKVVDVENVIKAYKFCKNNEGTCDKCVYFPKKSKLFGCPINNDMLSAISEQQAEIDRLNAELQPIKPDIDEHTCRCGRCDDYIMSARQAKVPINRERIRFCGHCGQPIDWTDLEEDGEQE